MFRRMRQVVLVSVLDGITTPLDWVQQHMPIGDTCLAVGPKKDAPIIYHHIYPLPDGWTPEGPLYPTCAVKIVTETSFREHWQHLFSTDVYHAVYKHLFP
jgi:hypothetical protein